MIIPTVFPRTHRPNWLNEKMPWEWHKARLEEQGYIIPVWCGMGPGDHLDGMGGCLSIAYGHVQKEGEGRCENCIFYKPVTS